MIMLVCLWGLSCRSWLTWSCVIGISYVVYNNLTVEGIRQLANANWPKLESITLGICQITQLKIGTSAMKESP